jgi:hypothetical protein
MRGSFKILALICGLLASSGPAVAASPCPHSTQLCDDGETEVWVCNQTGIPAFVKLKVFNETNCDQWDVQRHGVGENGIAAFTLTRRQMPDDMPESCIDKPDFYTFLFATQLTEPVDGLDMDAPEADTQVFCSF